MPYPAIVVGVPEIYDQPTLLSLSNTPSIVTPAAPVFSLIVSIVNVPVTAKVVPFQVILASPSKVVAPVHTAIWLSTGVSTADSVDWSPTDKVPSAATNITLPAPPTSPDSI